MKDVTGPDYWEPANSWGQPIWTGSEWVEAYESAGLELITVTGDTGFDEDAVISKIRFEGAGDTTYVTVELVEVYFNGSYDVNEVIESIDAELGVDTVVDIKLNEITYLHIEAKSDISELDYPDHVITGIYVELEGQVVCFWRPVNRTIEICLEK